MTTCTRRIEWDAGHRLQRHESKCAQAHGHRYVAELTVEAPELDAVGRVVDFGEIKRAVGGWVDANWDHRFLVEATDPLAALPIPGLVLVAYSPTAENMAAHLFSVANQLLPAPLLVQRVRLYETPNAFVEVVRC